VILLAAPAKPSLAAQKKRRRSPSSGPTSTPKNRVWNFANTPSGRPSVESQLTQETATGSVQFTYESASGRAEWLSRDPLEDAELSQGSNLYWYVGNDPVNQVDPSGEKPSVPIGGGLFALLLIGMQIVIDQAPANFATCQTDPAVKCRKDCFDCCSTTLATEFALLDIQAGIAIAGCFKFIAPWIIASCSELIAIDLNVNTNSLNDIAATCRSTCVNNFPN